MKWFILIVSCFPALAQHPLFSGSGIDWTRASAITDPSPAGINGALFYWNYTNTLLNTFTTNWVDQISGKPFLWNTTRAANTRPTNSTHGVYFDGFNVTSQALTNDHFLGNGSGSWSNYWQYISLKPNGFDNNPLYLWGPGGTGHGVFRSGTSKIYAYFTPNGNIAFTIALASNTEYDFEMVSSNGVMWFWTNGIAAVTAGSLGYGSANSFDPTSLGGDLTANGYSGFIHDLAIGTNGYGGQFFGSVQASNLHWWRTNVIQFSTP